MAIKIALAGNPNCGKTTLFNNLTGSNQYVGNWPGVTVEKKEGKLKGHDLSLIHIQMCIRDRAGSISTHSRPSSSAAMPMTVFSLYNTYFPASWVIFIAGDVYKRQRKTLDQDLPHDRLDDLSLEQLQSGLGVAHVQAEKQQQ